MDSFLTALFIALAGLASACHFISVFKAGKISTLFTVINLILHIAIFAVASLRWQSLEAVCLVLMASLFLYLVLSAIRVKFFNGKKGGKNEK